VARKPTQRARLAELARGLERVGPAEFAALREALAPVTESRLRRLLRDSGLPLAPLVAGVRQDDFPSLAASLLDLHAELTAARRRGDRATESRCRKLVIEAKDHARWAAKRAADPARRAAKEEMAVWMLVWLENPDIFPAWLGARKAASVPPAAP
jgi:hypothetical protein